MANTGLKLGLAALVVAAVGVTLFMQYQAQTHLAEENAALRQQLAQAQAENERLSNAAMQPKEPEPPPVVASDELLRLRGEVALLRQQTKELAHVRQENRGLLSQLSEPSQPTNQLSQEDLYVLQQTHATEALHTVLGAVKDYAAKHNGQYPENLQELVTSGSLKSSTFAGNLRLEDFEFNKPAADESGTGTGNFLRMRTLLHYPGGVMMTVSGGLDAAGNVRSEIRNWMPK